MARILIVDDNRELADDLCEILEQDGHEVAVAYSAEEALECAVEFAYDAALIDIMMHGMDGVELVRRLLPERSASAHLFMTGWSDSRRTEEAARLSARDVFYKPLDLSSLVQFFAQPNAGPSSFPSSAR
jgi:DNA-binding response OmpR family regulator